MSTRIGNTIAALCMRGAGTAVLAAGIGANVYGQPAVATGTAPGPAAAVSTTNYTGARIQFDSGVYDFGKVISGEQVKHTFYFTNTGTEDLILSNVHGSCGCTVVGDWVRTTKPGQSGAIPIVFNTINYSVPLSKPITVVCNDQTHPRGIFTLQLKGIVWKPITVVPPALGIMTGPDVLFASASARITNALDQLITLSAPESANPLFTAHLDTNVLERVCTLVVSNSAPLPPGNARGSITIRTGLTNPAALTVSVWANTQPRVSVSPEHLMLRRAPLATNQLLYVRIVNNSTNPITVTEPTLDAKEVTVTVTEDKPGRQFTAALKFPTGFELQAGQPLVFTAKTSDPKLPLVRVPISQLPRQAASAAMRPPPRTTPPRAAIAPRPPRPAAAPPPPAPTPSSP